MLTPISFPFSRATKKVAYEGQLEGVRIVPIQAVTASALMLIALTETYLFFTTSYAAAMILHL